MGARIEATLSGPTKDDRENWEGLCKEAMVEALKQMHARGNLHAIAVDEAHCVVEWSTFRPESVLDRR